MSIGLLATRIISWDIEVLAEDEVELYYAANSDLGLQLELSFQDRIERGRPSS